MSVSQRANPYEPPIAASSVPRCPCEGAQPCACERYARRLEQRYQSDQLRMMTAARALGLIAARVDVGSAVREAVLNVAMELC